MDPDDYAERMRRKLAPEVVRRSLVQAGAVLTGYELVRALILDRVRGFFTHGVPPVVGPRYTTAVLALDPTSAYRACWRGS